MEALKRSSVPSRARWLTVFTPFFVVFFLLGTLWSLATPIFATPDESAHATKAVAQLRGQFTGYEAEGVRFPVIDLPDSYRYSDGIVCFVPQPNVPADCGVELGTPDGTPWFGNWVLSYNPLYYYIVGWPTLFLDGNTGVYAMRLVSSLIGALLLAVTCHVALAAGSRRWMPLGLAFLASPMIMFLTASVNPQGPEITAGALSWVALLRLFECYRDGRRPPWGLWLAVTVGALFLTQARALGPLWWLVIALLALAAVGAKQIRAVFIDKRAWPWMCVIVLFAAAAALWTLKSGTVAGQADTEDAALVGGSALDGLWAMLRNTPTYVEQAIGLFGWLDTPVNGIVLGLYLAAAFVVILFAFVATGRKGAYLVIGTVAAAILIPPVVQAAAVSRTGLIWQGRYSLFLYIGVVLVAAWILSSRGDRRIDFLSVRVATIVAAVLGIYHVLVFVSTLRRYVVGNDTPITEMIYDPQWQPPLGWPVLVASLIVVMAAFTALLVVAARQVSRLGEDPAVTRMVD